MTKTTYKSLIILLCTISFYLPILALPPQAAAAAAADVGLVISRETVSATLKEAPLGVVLERISGERGFWVKGGKAVLDEKVSVEFAELPLLDGLKRILSQFSHDVLFDQDGRIIGVEVVARIKPGSHVATGSTAGLPASMPGSANPTPRPSVETTEMELLTGGLAESSKKEMQYLTVVTDTSPPGGPIQISQEELKSLEIVKDCEPPGGPVKVTARELESLEVVKNCPAP